MRRSVQEREQARRLRSEGMPYKRIAAELGVSVGSAFVWTRDIEPLHSSRPAAEQREEAHRQSHADFEQRARKEQRLPYGVCTLRVHSTWMGPAHLRAIQEYGGFEEPGWLD